MIPGFVFSLTQSPPTPHTCACVCVHVRKPLCGLLNLFVIIARILITGLSYDLILEPFLEVWLNGLSSKVLSHSFVAYFNVLRSLQPLLSSDNNFSLYFFVLFICLFYGTSVLLPKCGPVGESWFFSFPLCISSRLSSQPSAFTPTESSHLPHSPMLIKMISTSFF